MTQKFVSFRVVRGQKFLGKQPHAKSAESLAFALQLKYNKLESEVTMAASEMVQARIDGEIKDRAGAVLEKMGLTVSDAVRMLLTRIAYEGALPVGLTVDPATYDAWFRAKVQEALDDPRPVHSHEEVEAHFAKRRAAALRKAEGQG